MTLKNNQETLLSKNNELSHMIADELVQHFNDHLSISDQGLNQLTPEGLVLNGYQVQGVLGLVNLYENGCSGGILKNEGLG